MRKICVVTGTRAEYGLLKWLMHGIKQSSLLKLQVVVTGQHLSHKFGMTYHDIENDGFHIDKTVDLSLMSDASLDVVKAMSTGLTGLAEAFDALSPDIVVLLGDRYELLSAATAATLLQIPIAHIHGGETTEGAVDEAIRHAITKMAHLHFVAANEYRARVIQLGEHPERVFVVNGLGVDAITKVKLLERQALEQAIEFNFGDKNLLVTFHPVTLEKKSAYKQMRELISALDKRPDTHIIFTAPNADPDNASIFDLAQRFCQKRDNARFYVSLGQLNYLSCLKQVDAVVGNSSSGLIEAPCFNVATINIGDRQRGRLKATSVIDCDPTQQAISDALEEVYSPTFQLQLKSVINPYGTGGASEKIINVLQTFSPDNMLKKHFYNLNVAQCV